MTPNNNDTVTSPTLFAELFHNIRRHNLISTVAERFLSDAAREELERLTSLPFSTFGGWADQIRNNPPNDTETRNFLNDPRNTRLDLWHFVNIPLEIESYEQAQEMGFTRENDVVQIIRESVEVFTQGSDRFSKVNALRWLAHLVGDVHQPIHAGCAFINDSVNPARLVFDPQEIRDNGFGHDRGGNRLLLPGAGNMHSYWDGVLGGNIQPDDVTPLGLTADTNNSTESNAEELAVEKLFQMVRDAPNTSNAVELASALPIERRAEQWALESIQAAREAYRNIEIISRQEDNFRVSWEGFTTNAGKAPYDARCTPVLLERITSGVRNLSDLLNELLTL